MKRRSLLLGAVGLGGLGPPHAIAATPAPGKRRLAVLLFGPAEAWSFFQPELGAELAVLGWVEGTNLSVEWRYGNDDPALLRSHAAALVASAPDAILTRGTPGTRALQQATRTIPILTGVGDPVGSGFARTLAQPSGNVTGLSYAAVENSQKQMELLRLLVPGLASVVVVAHASRAPFLAEVTGPFEVAAHALGLTTRTALVGDLADLERAFRNDGPRGKVGASISGLGKDVDPAGVARVALAAGVPTMFEYRFYVDAGGLASYRLNWDQQTRRAAAQLDKVFRGEDPARIPFELPTRSEFVLNRTTARSLGLTLNRSLLAQADAVVD